MASLAASLSSLYQQYSTVATQEFAASISDASRNYAHARPTFGQILTSKRLRYVSTALLALGIFVLAFQNYDSLPSLASLSAEYTSGYSKASCPDCRVTTVPSANDATSVDWSRFAYTQYVTNPEYLCNSVMIFETLFRLGSKADRLMMYPEDMMDPRTTYGTTDEARLLIKARDQYNVKLQPIAVQSRMEAGATWAESYTKLLAFNQTQYDRVLNVDSDSTILQSMDELFLSPPCPVAMPRAYWLFPKQKILSSQIMLIQPSAIEFDRIMKKMQVAGPEDYDMEIVNQLYLDQAMILPHRQYDLLTGEFRSKTHENYLGTDREAWDPVAIFNEAKFLHFSDWPVPKPWYPMDPSMRLENQPKCVIRDNTEDCSAREIWNMVYDDFRSRRTKVCKTRHFLGR